MTAMERNDQRIAKLLVADAEGEIRHLPRAALASLLEPGDLVVANDAATLPASLAGSHCASGSPIEIRLAGWVAFRDPTRFVAVAFGAGDHRIRTEDRPPPPTLAPGDKLELGQLVAMVEAILGHPRLIRVRFAGERASVVRGLARHGRPIQYAHQSEPLALRDIWTKFAAEPIAFEPPSAAFALDWRMLPAWRRRGVSFATLSHAAGLSSTGDPALDGRLPFDELYRIPDSCSVAVLAARERRGRVIAVGTSVVRALESAVSSDGVVRAGLGVASGRIGRGTALRVARAILTGVHQEGESHYELLRAFAGDAVLRRIRQEADKRGYRAHERGDSFLIERQTAPWSRTTADGDLRSDRLAQLPESK
jgi:S-adenosylmethionine:tRNA ribosyltransferase-isomerase